MRMTPEQIENLNKLSDYLWKGEFPEGTHFDMCTYCAKGMQTQPTCGSVGCAVGHGPYAGIEKIPGEGFSEYCERCFGCGLFSDFGAWDWCFSGKWEDVDNTAKGAAKRIQWLLEKGTPSHDDIAEQQCATTPLCYETWTPPRYAAKGGEA
jgi:hypothetical protein